MVVYLLTKKNNNNRGYSFDRGVGVKCPSTARSSSKDTIDHPCKQQREKIICWFMQYGVNRVNVPY